MDVRAGELTHGDIQVSQVDAACVAVTWPLDCRQVRYDDTHQANYFYNTHTQKSHWTIQEARADWRATTTALNGPRRGSQSQNVPALDYRAPTAASAGTQSRNQAESDPLVGPARTTTYEESQTTFDSIRRQRKYDHDQQELLAKSMLDEHAQRQAESKLKQVEPISLLLYALPTTRHSRAIGINADARTQRTPLPPRLQNAINEFVRRRTELSAKIDAQLNGEAEREIERLYLAKKAEIIGLKDPQYVTACGAAKKLQAICRGKKCKALLATAKAKGLQDKEKRLALRAIHRPAIEAQMMQDTELRAKIEKEELALFKEDLLKEILEEMKAETRRQALLEAEKQKQQAWETAQGVFATQQLEAAEIATAALT